MTKQTRKRIKVFGNCRGNTIFDALVFVMIVFVIFIGAIGGKYVFNEINTEFQADDTFTNESKELLDEQNDNYGSFLDGIIVFLFICLWFVLLVSAWLIDSNPIFFVISLIIMIAFFIMAMFIGNIFGEIAGITEFAFIASQFPMTNFIMENILIFAIAIGFSILLVTFGKNQL